MTHYLTKQSCKIENMHGFCSGAPGVGMACLKLRGFGIPDCSDDLEKAVNKCLSEPLSGRDNCCCGNSAPIEFLLDAGEALGRPELSRAALERLHRVCERAAGARTIGRRCSPYLPSEQAVRSGRSKA